MSFIPKSALDALKDAAVAEASEYTDTAISTEVTNRDTAISTAVGTEATTRGAADTALDGRVDTLETASADHETRIGTLEEAPGGGGGDVSGVGASVAGEIPVYTDTTGKEIESSGQTIADVIADAVAAAGGGGGGAVYEIAESVDFTALGSQTLTADGSHTIDGKSYTKINTAFESTVMAVSAANGLAIVPGAGSDYFDAANTAPALERFLQDIDPEFNVSWGVRFWTRELGEPPYAAAPDCGRRTIDVGTETAFEVSRMFTAAATQLTQSNNKLDDTTYTLTPLAHAAGNRVLMIEVPDLLQHRSIVYYGAWSGSWDSMNLEEMTCYGALDLGTSTQRKTDGTDALDPANWRVGLRALKAGSATALTVKYGGYRVDFYKKTSAPAGESGAEVVESFNSAGGTIGATTTLAIVTALANGGTTLALPDATDVAANHVLRIALVCEADHLAATPTFLAINADDADTIDAGIKSWIGVSRGSITLMRTSASAWSVIDRSTPGQLVFPGDTVGTLGLQLLAYFQQDGDGGVDLVSQTRLTTTASFTPGYNGPSGKHSNNYSGSNWSHRLYNASWAPGSTDDQTFAMWVRYTGAPGGDEIDFGGAGDGTNYAWTFYRVDSGGNSKLGVNIYNGSFRNADYPGGPTVSPDTTYLLLGTFYSIGGGNYENTFSVNGGSPVTAAASYTTGISYLGSQRVGFHTTGDGSAGETSDGAIWRRKLSVAEGASLYNSGAGRFPVRT